MHSRIMKVGCLTLLTALAIVAVPSADDDQPRGPFEHVLLISIDGMHQIDLEKYVAAHPYSALAELTENGRMYTNASAMSAAKPRSANAAFCAAVCPPSRALNPSGGDSPSITR